MKYLAHLIAFILLGIGALFFTAPNPTAVFGINPALGLMFIAPAIVLLVLIMRRTV